MLTLERPLTVGGIAATSSTPLDNLDQTTSGYAAGDRILIKGTRVDGSTVDTVFTAAGTAADTVGALLDVINTAFLSATPGLGATANLDSAGRIVMTANQPGVSKMSLSIGSDAADASASTGITNVSNFLTTVIGREGGTTTSAIEIFDGQFNAHNVTFTYQRVAFDEWKVTASLDNGAGTITRFGEDNAVAGLKFNENGSFQGVVGTQTAQSLALGAPLTNQNVAATLTTPLDQLDQHATGPYVAGDVLMIAGTERDGQPIAPVSFDPVGKTVGDLLDAINSAFLTATAVLDASGNIVLTSDTTGQSELSLQIADATTNTGRTQIGAFSEAIRGSDGDEDITFQMANVAGFGSNQTIRLSFGTEKGFDGLTQFGGFNSAASTDQDGFAQGTLVDENVEQDGIVTGIFSNGRTAALAQIAVATFANPQGLQRVGNNYFTFSPSSGSPVITTASAGGAGAIQSGVLESSNVDVGVEFTQLIAAQRGFQVNARAFSIANQLLEETANLLR